MDATSLSVIIPAVTALAGAVGTAVWTLIKYKDAKKKEKLAEEKEFYLYISYNLVIESERLFGNGHGEEKKRYAMTRIQNEAVGAGRTWNPKLASTSIEQAVALRNDYKNTGLTVGDLVKQHQDKVNEDTTVAETNLKTDIKEVLNQGSDAFIKIKSQTEKTKDPVTSVKED